MDPLSAFTDVLSNDTESLLKRMQTRLVKNSGRGLLTCTWHPGHKRMGEEVLRAVISVAPGNSARAGPFTLQ